MTDPALDLSGGVEELAGLLLDEADFDQTLQRVVDAACQTVDGCDMASVTMRGAAGPSTVVFTERAVPEIDAAQYRAGSGPCLDALRELRTFRYDAATTEERWLEFGRAAAAQGIFSAIAYPLVIRGEGIGALNLYSESPGAFHTHDEARGELFASQAAVTLANAQLYQAAREVMTQLEEALATRDLIGQAKGILMHSLGLTADQAFDVLRRESQNRNVKIRDLADQISYTGALPTAPPST